MEFAVPTALRLVIPLTVLRWPLPGILLSMILDVYDWRFFTIESPEDNSIYQNWDRIMDMYFWIVTLFIVFKWKSKSARIIALSFFTFRMIGQLSFFLTQDRSFLFFFPNFYDNFLVMYLGYTLIFKRTRLIDSALDALFVFPLLMMPKTIHEYFLHYLQIQPWERYNVAELLGFGGALQYYVNYSFWGALFYVLPFLGVFLYYRYRLRDPEQGLRWGLVPR